MGWYDELCSSLNFLKVQEYTKSDIVRIIGTFSDVATLKKESQYVYKLAHKMGLIKTKKCHLTRNKRIPYSYEELALDAQKYKSRGEFRKKSKNIYQACVKMGVLNEVCAHMPDHVDQSGESNPFFKWTNEALHLEALKYKTRSEFRKNSHSAYTICVQRQILEQVCSHMKRPGSTGPEELAIFNSVLEIFKDTKKYKTNKVCIKNKPHIKGLEIDIFIPSLMKGIEFDGTWTHSFEGLKWARPHWPDRDVRSYHKIKDLYFASRGITILHIKEKEWKNNQNECISQIEQFLGITGFMSESEQKAA